MTIPGSLFACTPQSAAPTDAATQAALGTGAAVPDSAVAGTAAAVLAVDRKPTAKELFLFDEWLVLSDSGTDASFTRRLMSLYQRAMYGSANWVPITGWDGIFDTLLSYSSIDRVVLFTHGIPGGLFLTIPVGAALLDGTVVSKKTFDSPSLTDVVEELARRAGAENLPRVDEWIFEGCSVGRSPREMAAVKNAFRSTRVSGQNLHLEMRYWSLPANAAGRTAVEYADARARYDATETPFGRVPARNSTLFLPGMNDLSDTIGSRNFDETMWTFFSAGEKSTYREVDRAELREVFLTTYQAEQQYWYANETDAHRIIVED